MSCGSAVVSGVQGLFPDQVQPGDERMSHVAPS